MIKQYKLVPKGFVPFNSKVTLVCDIHGPFEVITHRHYSDGVGCPFCRKNKLRGYWTKEKCIEDAKKYKSRSEWEKNQEVHIV